VHVSEKLITHFNKRRQRWTNSRLMVKAEVALGRRGVDERIGGSVLEGGDPAHTILAI
jgi:hypothetical protein